MTDIVQMDELVEAERQAAKPAWRTRAFWQSAIPLFVSAVLLIVGTVLATKHYQTQVGCSLLVLHGRFAQARQYACPCCTQCHTCEAQYTLDRTLCLSACMGAVFAIVRLDTLYAKQKC